MEIFMNTVIQFKQKERGQSMVELALIFVIIMILLAGTADLGRAFFTWLAMRDAAQEGASYGTICPGLADRGELESRVRDNLDLINVYTVTVNAPNTSPGKPIKVTVDTDLPINTPFLSTILGSPSIAIHATINDTILSTTCPKP
jgi:Flp pilus assembly protein TadG